MPKRKYFIVELEDGLWLSPTSDNPGKSINIESAQRFTSKESATKSLLQLQKSPNCSHPNASIIPVEELNSISESELKEYQRVNQKIPTDIALLEIDAYQVYLIVVNDLIKKYNWAKHGIGHHERTMAFEAVLHNYLSERDLARLHQKAPMSNAEINKFLKSLIN